MYWEFDWVNQIRLKATPFDSHYWGQSFSNLNSKIYHENDRKRKISERGTLGTYSSCKGKVLKFYGNTTSS